MTRFIQLHMLTSYPPANLNRDDLGRPKTAWFGGSQRIRVSSQSLKRAWRKSDRFEEAMSGHIGTRTKRLGVEAYERLVAGGVKEKQATKWAKEIGAGFGKLQEDAKDEPLKGLMTEQLVHVAPEERAAINRLVDHLIKESRELTKDEIDALLGEQSAVDIAMFGRMLADRHDQKVEAAIQVAHALGVHASAIEDDFFTAVDDLKKDDDDAGAGHLGETGFAAAVFYQYICIDTNLLVHNLGGNEVLARRAIRALVEVAHEVAPTGKQNSFGSRAYAFYTFAEKGDRQPRSLALAFLKAVSGGDYAQEGKEALIRTLQAFDKAYDDTAFANGYELDVLEKKGTLSGLLDYVAPVVP